MNISRQTKQHAARIGKIAAVMAVATLTLGTIDAEPVAGTATLNARAASLDPAPFAANAPTPVVKQEVVTETAEAAPVVAQATPVKKASRPSGSCGLDYIKSKESGGRYNAVSKSGKYRGAYQFDQRTWNSVGGSGDPAAASPAEQDARAAALYAKRGSQPWGVCGFR